MFELMFPFLSPSCTHIHKSTLEITFVISGQIRYKVNNITHTVKGGELFLTYPDELHTIGYHPHMHFCWLGVDITSPGKSFLGFRDPDALKLCAALRQMRTRHFRGGPIVKECIDRFIAAILSNLPYRKLIARAAMIELLTYLIEAEKQSQRSNLSPLISKSVELIETQIENPVALQEIADTIHISLPHFKKIFRQEMGLPPYEYVLHRKIDRAKKMLADLEMPVTDIAFHLGFPSSQHFATLFKKMTSQTPSCFRKERFHRE